MWLAGIPVREDLVRYLARLLEEDGVKTTAAILHTAVAKGQAIAAPDIDDREAILITLDDPPEGLGELRGVLLREHEWRRREGLA